MNREVKSAPAGNRIPEAKSDDTGAFGQQIVKNGRLSEREVADVVAAQKRNNLRFGEAAMSLGLMKNQEVEMELARQYDYPCPTDEEVRSFGKKLYTVHAPQSNESEAIRSLRSHLMLNWFSEVRSTLAISAARSGEGVSTVAANLAVAFAQLGERTLLIDANFRNPSQHRIFGLKPEHGLSSLLANRCAATDALTPVPGFRSLSVICAGATPPNPQELLSRVTFSYLAETAPAAFDIVIVDAPPVLEYGDARIIGARMEGCLLTARRHTSLMSDVRVAKELLASSNVVVVGAVLND
jgi:protein-tyrosine kinase